MSLTFEDLPEVDAGHIRGRLRPPSRRNVLRGLAIGGVGLAFGVFSAVNRGADEAEAAYFKDWKDTSSGPCKSYARKHTERGIRCGPSTMCKDQRCCWKYFPGADNKVGWHKRAPGIKGTYYLHRPDACWAGSYDSWRWKFSDGKTYRCSDGWTCRDGSCYKTICPWAV